MANGRCRMQGGKSPGAPKGNSHAFKHGRYTAEAIAERRTFAALRRDMKRPIEQVGRRGVKNLAQSDGPQDHDRDRIARCETARVVAGDQREIWRLVLGSVRRLRRKPPLSDDDQLAVLRK
jgi:hypothetical protein